MSLKLVNKQHRVVTPNRSNANTTTNSKLASSSGSVSRTPNISIMNVSVGEHRRVLAKNETITKENAILKQQLRQLKTDLLCAKSLQTDHRNQNTNEKLTFESFMTALSLMNKIIEYLSNGLEDMDSNMHSMRTIMSNCESVLRNTYPQYYADFQQNNGMNMNAETSGESRSSAQRFSMSAERREHRRKSLLDTIKQAFHAFTELSTIIEMSKELRVSSGNFSQTSVRSAIVNNDTENQLSLIYKKPALSDTSNTRSDNRMDCNKRFVAINSRESNKENINPNESIALSPPLHSSSPNRCANDSEKLRAELESIRFDENDEQCSVMPNNPIDFDLSSSECLPRRSKRNAKKRMSYEELAEDVEIIAVNSQKSDKNNDKTKSKPNPKQTRKQKAKKTVKFAITDSFSDELPSVYDFSDETPALSESFAEYRRTLANKSN